MKRFLFALLTLCCLFGCGSEAPAAVLIQSTNGTYVSKGSIYAANTAADAAGKTVIVTSPVTLTSNITLATDRAWKFEKGAVVTTTGYTFDVNFASLGAGSYQIFGGTGSVINIKEGNPIWFGGKGDGVTDDSLAVQRCLNASVNSVGHGDTYYIPSGVSITAVNKSVSNMILKNGSLTIGASTGSPVELHTKVQGVKFTYTTRTNGSHGLILQRARAIEILDNTFIRCDHAIHINKVDAIQHVNRLRITGNKFSEIGTASDDRCNYALFADGYDSAFTQKPLTVGDIDFIGNIFVKSRITHVYIRGVDGFTSLGNRLYFDGSVLYPDGDKRQNIFVEYSANIIINSNQLFVPGYEAVYMSHVRDYTVNDNIIIAPGQVALKDAILVENGALSGSDAFGVISNNVITYPSKSGIRVGASTNNVLITNNNIRYVGTAGFYYGDAGYGGAALGSISHYGVDLDPTAAGCLVSGNLTPHNANNISTENNNSFFIGNFDSSGNSITKPMKTSLTGTETSISLAGKNELLCAQTAATTVTSLSDGADGQIVHIRALNGNTTFSGTAIVGGPYTVPANKGMVVRYFTSPAGWYVTGKSF